MWRFNARASTLAIIALLWLPAGCTTIVHRLEASALLGDEAKEMEDDLNRGNFWNRQCATGVLLRNDGQIISLSDRATHAGLRQGDKVTSIDSHTFEDSIWFVDAMHKHSSGDVIHFSVMREGTSREASIECHDLTEVKALDRRLITALRNNDRAECLRIVSDLNSEAGPSSDLLYIDLSCRYGSMTSKESGTAGALALYNLGRTLLDEITTDRPVFEKDKPGILAIIKELRSTFGNNDLANALQEKLKQSELETYGKTAPNTPAQQGGTAPGKIISSGSGFAVAPDGTILTSAHVVAGSSAIVVTVSDGSTHPAKVLQLSAQTDIAVLKIDGATPSFLQLASASTARPGDKVFTIGFPAPDVLGVRPKYSEGAISALSGIADDATWMQVSIPIQPGNSGGPVVDVQGRVIGILAATAAVANFYKETGALPQNVNWAVKADYARPLLDAASPADAPRLADASITDQVTKAVCHIEATIWTDSR